MNGKQAWWSYGRVVLGATLGLSACSSGTQGGSTAGPVPQAEFPAQAAATMCDGLGRCCRSQGFAFDDTACRSAWQTTVASNTPTSTAVAYDANAAGECLAALRSVLAACGDADTVDSDACSRMYVGSKPAGAACTESEECAAPADGYAYCSESVVAMGVDGGVSGGASSVCVVELPTVHGALGQSCSLTCASDASGESCSSSFSASTDGGASMGAANVACYTNDGLYCSSAYTCQKLSEVGGSCDGYAGCVSTAYCDSTTNLCAVRGEPGATCSGWLSCVDTAFCGATGVCEAKKADGQPCSISYNECLGYCSTARDTGTGTCAAGTEGSLVNADSCAGDYGM
jgi:hypothetical protein